MSHNAENLDSEQMAQLVDFLMYRLDPETRQTLATTLPVAYNAYCGEQIVKVVSVKDDTRTWLPLITKFEDGKFVKERKPF